MTAPAATWGDERDRLLLRSALLGGADGATAWEMLRPRLDVDSLSGDDHRLLPLLARNLTRMGIDDPDLPRLEGVGRRNWYRNSLLLRDLAGIVRGLGEAGMDTMVLGGAALVLHHYRDASLRPVRDLDVLVRPEQAEDAVRLVARTGRVPRPSSRFHPWVRLEGGDAGSHCDIHWHAGRGALDPWSAAEDLELEGGVRTRALGAADQLVAVCVHGNQWRSGTGPAWAADAMRVISGAPDRIDWDRAVDQAERRREVIPLRLALRFLGELGAPVPAEVQARLGALPAGRRQAFAYRVRAAPHGVGGAAEEALASYARATLGWPVPRVVAGLPAYLQERWRLDRRWHVPAHAAARLRRRPAR